MYANERCSTVKSNRHGFLANCSVNKTETLQLMNNLRLLKWLFKGAIDLKIKRNNRCTMA